MRRYAWYILGVTIAAGFAAMFYRSHMARRHAQNIDLATEAIQMGRLDEAIAFLNASLSYRPNDPQSRYMMAHAYQLQGRLEDALQSLRQVHLDNANAELIAFQTAGLLLALNRPGESEAVLRDCLKQFPQSVAARQYLLDVLGLQLRQREMLAVLDELWKLAQRRSPLDKLWVLAKTLNVRFIKINDEEVWPALQASLQQEPSNVNTQVASAKLRMMLNADVDIAARSLEACLDQDPSNIEALAALTSHYVERGGVDDNRINDLLGRWSAVDHDAEYWDTLGDWQLRQDKLPDALQSYRQATAQDASQWRTWHKMGLLLVRMAKARDEVDEPLAAEGRELIERAASLKELRGESKKHFDFLQATMSQSAQGDATKSRLPARDLAQLATFCEAVHCDADALRWCELVQEILPGEPITSDIRIRLNKRKKATIGPG